MSSLCLPRVINLGEGALQEIGKMAKQWKVSHLFVMTGSLLLTEPYKKIVEDSIRKHNLKVTFYLHTKGEPTTDHVNAALLELERCGADGVAAIGGGSVIDLAKAVSVFAVHPGLGFDEIPTFENLDRLPLIAVPTTAGTGSEATKVMVITETEKKVKKNPGHIRLIPDVALLDPMLTLSLPKAITAYTGMDALTHAIEAFVSTKATVLSDHFALEAIRLIGGSLPVVFENGNDRNAREKLLLGSCYAGVAFSNASTNLAHAAARPLGARYKIPHGLCVALLLPFVIEYGLEESKERYAIIAKSLGSRVVGSDEVQARDLVEIIHHFNSNFHIWEEGAKYLKRSDDIEENLTLLITDALSGNGVNTNQRIPTAKDVEVIYRKLIVQLDAYVTR